MEAATIGGLVLGVIPLIISAVENYEVTFQPFVTYKHHVKEIRRFSARLDTQRAIFYNECQLLLVAIGQNLGDILADPSHPSRSDNALSHQLQELLGTSHHTCILTLNLINDILAEVTNETAGFKDLLEGHKSKGKSTWSMFRRKVKISFSKTRLNEIIIQLRDHNQDLGRIAAQIRNLSTLSPMSTSMAITNTMITQMKTTQQASIRLYDALVSGWPSDDCTEHIATMSLRVEEDHHDAILKVRFKVSVTCARPIAQAERLWFNIESIPNPSIHNHLPATRSAGLQSALQKIVASKRSVGFDVTSTTIGIKSSTGLERNSWTQVEPQLDLRTMGKLCQYFRQINTQATEPGESLCVGFLEKPQNFRHLFYHDYGSKASNSVLKSLSLKEFLQRIADEKRDEDWITKLQLAKVLCLSVLRFHSTPWLPETWSSSDVQLLGNGCNQSWPTLENPYIEAQLSTATSARGLSQPSAHASALAANAMLFNLGIVLIELGHDAPFETLYERDQSRGDTSNQIVEFIAARKLGESVHKKLNRRYGRLVERCLNCNFGLATKLDDAELQSAVITHVINELDTCRQQYQAFNSLAPPILYT